MSPRLRIALTASDVNYCAHRGVCFSAISSRGDDRPNILFLFADDRGQPHFDWVNGKRPRCEFYDLNKDPHDTKNVAHDPEYSDFRAKLEAELLAELKSTSDPRLIDNGKFFETSPMSEQVTGVKKNPDRKPKGKKTPGAK